MMIVALDGTGHYTCIQDAINSIPLNNTEVIEIFIKKGTYKEKLHIDKPFITLIGEGATDTIITYDDYANKLFPDGESYGTFNSYTAFIGAHDFTAKHLTFENSSGPGSKVGQALALYVDADRAYFTDCRFIGNQDTLFTGPLPPAPIIPGSFKGPRENAPLDNGRQYYERCFIQGDIDFIFGSATAFFYECELFSNNLSKEINGYITAPSTPEGQEYGYVFESCKLTSDCPNNTVYLGRPWRIFAKAVFINSYMGPHIIACGWHNWNKVESEASSYFAEFGNTGAGSTPSNRVPWCKLLSTSEASHYSRQKVLSGSDHWCPWTL